MPPIQSSTASRILIIAGAILCLTAALAVGAGAAPASNQPAADASPFHPSFPLLDKNADHVLESGLPLSTMQTCGACHDTAFIEAHSDHASAGLKELTAAGTLPHTRPWDISDGLYGAWTSQVYRYLSPPEDDILDLGTAAWIQIFGSRHVGGGPAEYSRNGVRLDELAVSAGDPETQILDMQTGEVSAWDWVSSGVVEMNCFLCHAPAPDNPARIEALEAGEFGWANSATLLQHGILRQTSAGYVWNPLAFEDNGDVRADLLPIQDPENANCGLCHGLVDDGQGEPLVIAGCAPDRSPMLNGAQIISGQLIADSAINLQNKTTLSRPWDIHAQRLLSCTNCHYALNNPVYYQEGSDTRPAHLTFDPRRLELGEYLYQPLHQFARGEASVSSLAPELSNTMRRCESCHAAENQHDWLPYPKRHMQEVSCESCHVPRIYATSRQQQDWTVLQANGSANAECRGVDGQGIQSLVTGFEPVLLRRGEVGGETRLAPFNLVTTWYWAHGDPLRPVRLIDLQSAWFAGDSYRPEILAAFDANADGQINAAELRIDSEAKERLVHDNLTALGLKKVQIVGEIQAYSINHGVAAGEWALRQCSACHSQDSRLNRSFTLASYAPGGTLPVFLSESGLSGAVVFDADGGLLYQPDPSQDGIYVFGLDNLAWVDLLGGLAFAGVLLGILVHGSLRLFLGRQKKHRPPTERRYVYGVYERLWHWLQTFTIVALLFTGLVIHKPDIFSIFSFGGVVLVHNILAGILALNAALALFYHLASGDIRQFLPRPRGFFDQAISQSRFYLRGIFKGEPHPFEKTPDRKLNPLQQITYFAILNVLLPLQGLSGILMWGVQRWPNLASRLGGLPSLAPAHSLIAWLFAAFIVLHVYLTTTGSSTLESIKAMIDGWEEVEVHQENSNR